MAIFWYGNSWVFGLFARDIPQQGLARMDRGRKRQGIVPDFLLPGGGGSSKATLADLKFITGTVKRYPREPGLAEEPNMAVQRRAGLVDKGYLKHAIKLDIKFCVVGRAARGQLQVEGLVQRRLAIFGNVEGWVFGVWGEVSNTIHSLIHNMVESRLRVVGQQAGRPGRARALADLRSHLIGSLRRQVSFLAGRANARLLVSRMESHVGQGAG